MSHRKPNRKTIAAEPVAALESRRLMAATTPTFATLGRVDVGGSLVAIAAGDFNGDDNADVAVADQTGDDIHVLFGNGGGSFTTGPVLAVGGKPTDVAVADLNGDGHADILAAVVTSTSAELVAFLSNDNGTFNAPQAFVVNSASANDVLKLAVGDFNKDGHIDAAVADNNAAQLFVATGNGDGTFTSAGSYSTVSSPDAITVNDFNGDGNLDLAVTGTATGTGLPQSEIVIFTGVGDGTFAFGTELDGGANSADALASAELTNDGKPDLLVGTGDSTITELANNGSLTFTASQNVSLPGVSLAIATGDFNFDGSVDVAAVSPNDNDVTVLTNAGTGTGMLTAQTLSTGGQPAGVAVVDLNDDGKPDIVTANAGDGTVSVLLNTTAGTVAQSTTTTLTSSVNPASAQSPVSFTATVAASGTRLNTAAALPTGTVNFYDGTTLLGSAAIAGGTDAATFTTTALSVGSHSITATYVTDNVFAASTSTALAQSISATATEGPDLVGSVVSTTLPETVVAGETAMVRVKVTNQGNAAADATIVNAVYLSASGVVDSSSTAVAVKGKLSGGVLKLKPGQSSVVTGTVTVPANIAPGNYQLLVAINTTGTVSESDPTNNVAALATQLAAANAFGSVGGRARVPLTLTTAAGTATLKLTGPGTGAVAIDSVGGLGVTLTGTTAASTLTVTPAAKSSAVLSSILDSGVLGSLSAPSASLIGNLTLGGVKKISLGTVASTTWAVAGNVSQLSIAAVTNSGLKLGVTGTVNSFVDRGNLLGTVAAASFGSVLIDGNATGVDLLAGANLNTGAVSAGSIKTLRVVGSTTESVFAAGPSSIPYTGVLIPGLAAAAVPTITPLPGGSIKSITFGLLDADTRIVAASLPPSVRVDGDRVQTSGDGQFVTS